MAITHVTSSNLARITDNSLDVSRPTSTHAQSVQQQEQPVQFVQSVELVQTLVCAVISTVSSLRCFFPEDCFRIHKFDIDNSYYSYKSFIEATNEDSTIVSNIRQKKDHRYVPWEILLRGTNAGVDKLLDWIVSRCTANLVKCLKCCRNWE
jgi:hypothetical protein